MADIRIVPALGAINVTGSADFRGDSASTVLFVSGSGNVGVGTSNPISKLHVAGAVKATAVTGNLLGTSTDTGRAISILNSGLGNGEGYSMTLGFANSSNNQAEITYNLVATGSTSNRLSLGLYNSADTLNVVGTGRVGVGITNPSYTLHTVGQVAIQNAEADIWMINTGGGAGTWRILGSSGNTTKRFRIYDNDNSADRFNIETNGQIKFNTYGSGTFTGTAARTLAVDSSGNVIEISNTSLGGSGTANRVAYWTDANTLAADADFFFDGTNVGIGNTAPAVKLQVIGNIGVGAGTYNGGVYANSSTTAVDVNWGFDFLKTPGQEDYSTRLKYYPVTGDSRKGGIWNSRDNAWVIYGDSNNTPNVIIPSGSVGIGTTSPGYTLDVNGTIAVPSFIRLINGGPTITFLSEAYGINLNGDATHPVQIANTSLLVGLSGAGNNYGTGNLYVSGNSFLTGDLTVTGKITAREFHTTFVSASIIFQSGSTQFGNSSDDTHIFTGNVGIGTATPTGTYGKLTVAGGIQITNDNLAKLEIGRYSVGTPNSYIKLGTNSNSLRFTNNTDTADLVYIQNDGKVGINFDTPVARLQVVGTSTFNSDTVKAFRISDSVTVTKAVDIGYDAALDAGFIQSGNFGVAYKHLLLQPNDNSVGIGTTSPGFKLDVNGTGRFTSTLIGQQGLSVSGNGGAISNSANKINIDFASGNARVYSLGTNASTKGGFEFHTNSSDGSLDVIALGINPTGAATFSSSVTATSFVKTSGTSAQFLKADGSVDSSTYITAFSETDTLSSVTGRGASTSTASTFSGGLTTNLLSFTAPTGDPSPIITSRVVPAGQGAAAELTELILFHSNDPNNGAGPDYITLRSPAIRLQTYNDATVDDINDNLGSNDRLRIEANGTIKLSSLTSNGFVKTSGGDGALSIDTSTYLTAEADTLSSVTGRGASTSTAVTFSSTVTANSDDSGVIVDVAARHGLMKYFNYSTGLVGRTTSTDSNISTWLGRFSGTITAPTGVFQDLVINNSGSIGIGTTSPSTQFNILHPSNIAIDTVQGIIRLTGQSNTENAGTVPSAGTAVEFYNKWNGGGSTAEYSVGRISGRASQGYAGSLQFDVAPTQSPGQSNFLTAMSILRDGNVGIGTTSPATKLDIAGTLGFTAGAASAIIRRTGVNGSNGISIQGNANDTVSDTNAGASIFVGGGIIGDTFEGNIVLTAYGSIVDSNRNQIRFSNRSGVNTIAERMRINHLGAVGIGTTAPTTNLQVYQVGGAGNNYLEGTIQVGGVTSVLGAALSYAAQSSGYVNLVNLNDGGGANSRISFGFGAITSGLPANNVMTVNQSGNVGIGTSSPANKLQVVGTGTTINLSVVGNIKAGGTGTAGGEIITSGALGNGNFASFRHDDTNAYITVTRTVYDGHLILQPYANVGIGVTNPSAKLHVAGTIINSTGVGGTGDSGIEIGTGNRVGFDESGVRSWTVKAASGNLNLSSGDGNGWYNFTGKGIIATSFTGSLQGNITGTAASETLQTVTTRGSSTTTGMTIAGSVGIGTTNPTAKLQIGPEAHPNATGIEVAAGSGSGANLIARDNTSHHNWLPFTDGSNYLSADSHIFRNATHNVDWAIITSAGNLGIGTNAPTARLHVFQDSDVWHTRIGGATGELRIGGQNGSGAVIQAYTPADVVRDLYIQRDGGNIGIGNTSPSGKLHVTSVGGDGTPILRITGTASDSFNWASSTIFANLTAGETAIHQIGKAESQYNSGHYGYRHVGNGSSANMMTIGMFQADYLVNILGTGNVGIGITTPEAALQIAKTGTDDQLVLGSIATNRDIAMFMYSGTTKAEVLRFQSAFRLLIGNGSAITQQSFLTSGAERMSITSGGNVGINATVPGEKLDVNGNVALSGIFKGSGTGENKNFASYDWHWLGRRYATYVGDVRLKLYEYFYSTTATVAEAYVNCYDMNSVNYMGENIWGDVHDYRAIFTTHIYVKRQFTVSSVLLNGDDPYALWIDGAYVIGADSCCVGVTYSYTFTQGWHRIDLIYSEAGGGHYVSLGWNPKDYTDYIAAMTPFGPVNFFDTGDVTMRNNRVGIGTTDPSAKLEIFGFSTGAGLKLNYGNSSGTIEAVNFIANGGANGVIGMQMVSAGVGDLWLGGSGGRTLTLYRDGNVGIGSVSPAFKLDVSGAIRATGDVLAFSDARVKENIVTLENSLDLVTRLRGVRYNRIGESQNKIGVIAQEVLEVLPEVVQQDQDGNYSVAYGNLAGLFIESIKQHQQKIQTLEDRISVLEKLLGVKL